MTDPVWTFPGPILDMLAKGLREMGFDAPNWVVTHGKAGIEKIWMVTEAGPVTIRRLEGT